jgi:DNA-directed RNA polymerase specialized sigma24 family protein
MGATNHDKTAGHRRLEQRYGAALDNRESVRLLLSDYHALDSRRFKGDYAACDVLIDLHTAIERAGLTNRQREVLDYIYFRQYNQTETARELGIKQTHVSRHLAVAESKIARVFEAWARAGEGYALGVDNALSWEVVAE